MSDLGRIPASGEASIPGGDEVWTVGQHPAVSSGWIVRPVLFGSRVRVLPEHEGGHVILRNEADARMIGAAPTMLAALRAFVRGCDHLHTAELAQARYAIALATTLAEADSVGTQERSDGVHP
jgi:hypothetical protein